MKNKNCQLSDEEQKILKKLDNRGIPWIFKDMYLDYLLTIENIVFTARDLSKCKARGSPTIFAGMVSEFSELKNTININELDKEAGTYFYDLEQVVKIYEKYAN